MSNRPSAIQHESFDYSGDAPFLVLNIKSQLEQPEKLLPHWHEEMEIVYSFVGKAVYQIDGETYFFQPGRMLIARIFDGITDILMGAIVDKTNTRWGKAKHRLYGQ